VPLLSRALFRFGFCYFSCATTGSRVGEGGRCGRCWRRGGSSLSPEQDRLRGRGKKVQSSPPQGSVVVVSNRGPTTNNAHRCSTEDSECCLQKYALLGVQEGGKGVGGQGCHSSTWSGWGRKALHPRNNPRNLGCSHCFRGCGQCLGNCLNHGDQARFGPRIDQQDLSSNCGGFAGECVTEHLKGTRGLWKKPGQGACNDSAGGGRPVKFAARTPLDAPVGFLLVSGGISKKPGLRR